MISETKIAQGSLVSRHGYVFPLVTNHLISADWNALVFFKGCFLAVGLLSLLGMGEIKAEIEVSKRQKFHFIGEHKLFNTLKLSMV